MARIHPENKSQQLSEDSSQTSTDPRGECGCRTPRDLARGWLEELTVRGFWREVLAELLGTGLLVLFGAGATVRFQEGEPPATSVLETSLAGGLAVASVIWMLGHVSGSQVNPSITVGALITRRITIPRALFYLLAQCLGAIGAISLLRLLTPPTLRGNLGATLLSSEISVVQGLFIEIIISLFNVFCYFSTTDQKRTDLRGSGPLSVGLYVVVARLFSSRYTGGSMNPAASLGPALVMNVWTNYWTVYVCGPLIGGAAGALLYDQLFSANASLNKTKDFLIRPDYNNNNYS